MNTFYSIVLIVAVCRITSGNDTNIIHENSVLTIRRVTRSPVTYVADENGKRVVIITLNSPNNLHQKLNGNPNFGSSFGASGNLDPYLPGPNYPGLQYPRPNYPGPNYPKSFYPRPNYPGALQLIETLRNIGIPGLPPPTSNSSSTYLPPVSVPYTPPPNSTPLIPSTRRITIGIGEGPVGSPGFGADLSGGLLGGGFSKKQGNVEKPE